MENNNDTPIESTTAEPEKTSVKEKKPQSNYIIKFRTRLRALRIGKRENQSDLAEAIQCASSTISSYEKGRTQPSIDLMIAIARHYEISVDYLVGASDIPNPYNLDYRCKTLDNDVLQSIDLLNIDDRKQLVSFVEWLLNKNKPTELSISSAQRNSKRLNRTKVAENSIEFKRASSVESDDDDQR